MDAWADALWEAHPEILSPPLVVSAMAYLALPLSFGELVHPGPDYDAAGHGEQMRGTSLVMARVIVPDQLVLQEWAASFLEIPPWGPRDGWSPGRSDLLDMLTLIMQYEQCHVFMIPKSFASLFKVASDTYMALSTWKRLA